MSRDVNTTRIIDGALKALTMTGLLAVMIVAPNAIGLGSKALRRFDKQSQLRERRRILDYMVRKRLIIYTELPDGRLEVIVTEDGKRRADKVRFEDMQLSVPKQWDGKWRLVLFDVPEARRQSRTALSLKLRILGFYQLQKSAWVHPYPCADEIELIKQVFELRDQDIIVAEVTNLTRDLELKQHFKIHA